MPTAFPLMAGMARTEAVGMQLTQLVEALRGCSQSIHVVRKQRLMLSLRSADDVMVCSYTLG